MRGRLAEARAPVADTFLEPLLIPFAANGRASFLLGEIVDSFEVEGWLSTRAVDDVKRVFETDPEGDGVESRMIGSSSSEMVVDL